MTNVPIRRRKPVVRASTAYHEAGHAVAAYFLGRPIKMATVVPTDNTLGRVRLGGRNNARRLEVESLGPRARYRLERDLIGRLAGPEVERRLTGRRNSAGARFDHGFVADVAQDFSSHDEDEANAYLLWLERRTARLVNSWWPWIEKVATLLLERGTLSGRQICSVLDADADALRMKKIGLL